MKQSHPVTAIALVFALAALPASGLAQAPGILSVQPTQNASNVASSTDISVTFDVDMDAATINSGTFVVNTRTTGLQTGTYWYDAGTRTAWFDPDTDFMPGEIVSVVLTTDVTSQGVPLDQAFTWTFTAIVENGMGTFELTGEYAVEPGAHAVYAADLNGDGYVDLVVTHYTYLSDNSVSVLINNGDGSFAPPVDYQGGVLVGNVVAADLDGDNDMDLVVNNQGQTRISILENNGDGTFAPLIQYQTGVQPRETKAVDLDGDGDLDLAVATTVCDCISVLLNNGDGTFAPYVAYPVGHYPFTVAAADFNADGFMDLATGADWDKLSILINNGDGTFEPYVQYAVGANNVRGVVAADLDNDGDMDIAITPINGFKLSIMTNDGTGVFNLHAGPYYIYGNSFRIEAADFDADGDQDLCTSNSTIEGHWAIQMNNWDATFERCAAYEAGSGPQSFAISDLDGDGDLDVAIANGHTAAEYDDTIRVYLNVDGRPCPLLSFPEDAGDDTTSSLGAFVVLVRQQFRSMFADYPGYDPSNYNLRSPRLFDNGGTIIGRSDMHYDGDPDDATGVPTGTAMTSVGDNDFTLVPDGFQGPAGTEEIHTEIHALNMVHVSGAAVRAGIEAPSRPMSPGEIESMPGNSYGLPGESFFNVFVEVDIPDHPYTPWGAHMTVANDDPLLVTADNLLVLPPRVVYIHDNSSAVPVIFQNSNSPMWDSGDVMGYLVLAGHGVNMTLDDSTLFDSIIDTLPDIPPPYLEVDIDIKPYSCPNPLNINSNGVTSHFSDTTTPSLAKVGPGGFVKAKAVLPAAVLGSADLDVTEIDPSTVKLVGVPALRWNFGDVGTPNPVDTEECECNTIGADGYTDLTLKFDKSLVIEALGEVNDGDVISLTLTGELTDGSAFEGLDCMIIRAGGPGDEPGSSTTPDRPTLIGNFPNPFNPTTVFSFYLPKAAEVKLEVFNIMGQRVITLADEFREAGEHAVTWDSRDHGGNRVASGIYFYRLQADGVTTTKKMVLMR